jgi:hypothetical protein
MSFLIIPGRYLNILDECLSLVSSDPEPGYDAENVANNVPSHPFKFDDPGTNDYLLADLSRLPNGDMEDWVASGAGEVPDGFTKTGTVAKESTIKHGGSFSAKLSANANLWRIIWVPAGWEMTIECWLYGDGDDNMFARLRNLYTGNYLKTDSGWQAAETAFGSQAAAAWAKTTKEFVVEDYATCGYQHLVPLQILWEHEVGGTGGYVDDASIWPHWNFASIHGHNIPPTITVKYQSDDNVGMATPTTQATATVIQPSFFNVIGSMVTERFARLYLEGTVLQEKSILLGEFVLSQYRTLLHPHIKGPAYTRTMPSRGTLISKIPRSDWSERKVRLDFSDTDVELTRMYEMLDRARGGTDPFVIVPISTESDVMFGYFPTELTMNKLFRGHQTYSLEFQELAFPFTF